MSGEGKGLLGAVPDGPGSVALAEELEALAHRVGRFLSRLSLTADDVQIWLRRESRWAWRIQDREVLPDMEPCLDQIALRVWRDGRMGEASADRVDEALWTEGLERALKGATASAVPPPEVPRARRPGPMTFDPDLADQMSRKRELHRIADALCVNTWHEAERVPGLEHLTGHVGFVSRRYLVGCQAGVVASLHGDLVGHVELNGVYGDVVRQAHAPESYLPLALLGARTWRGMPRQLVSPSSLGLSDPAEVVLHPRLFEQLLRRFVGPRLRVGAQEAGGLPFDEGVMVAHRAVTLVDDSGLDGLGTSRAFDDEGVPTRRTPLLVRGRLTQLLRGRAAAARRGGAPTGSAWREAGEPGAPHLGVPPVSLGSLLMERGEVGFHDMVGAMPETVVLHAVDDLTEVDESGTFEAKVRWGVSLDRGMENRLLRPGAWTLRGRVLGLGPDQPGLLDDVLLSRELYDTGTAILPYCLCSLSLT